MTAADTLYERILAKAPAEAASTIRDSAAVVLWRRQPPDGGLEVYWVRRAPTLRFMGGWWAFPGGGLSPADAAVPLAGQPQGADAASRHRAASDVDSGDSEPAPDLVPGLVACALRELFEETGVLIAERAGAGLVAGNGLDADRRRLLADERRFAELVRAQALRLRGDRLRFAGRWLTPTFARLRFDNRFFLAEWPADRPQQPTILLGELDRGEWLAPAAALARWQRGEVLAAPPVLHILRVLAEDGPEDPRDRLRDTREADLGPMRAIDFLPAVHLLPLRVPTLPPATHTNAALVGSRDAVLVDPAPGPGAEQDRLIACLEAARETRGIEVREVWLTHHHRDHVRGAMRVRDHFGVPIAAHELSRHGLAGQGVSVDRVLADGERRHLVGPTPLDLEVIHTPGHTRGHVAILIEPWRAVLAGDLASTLSTIVIDPPEGDMEAYLASLERLRAREPRFLLPAHGPLITDAARRLDELRRHRLAREAEVAAAWRRGLRQPLDLVDAIYGRLEPMIRAVAARQVEAHLGRLRHLGLVD